MKKLMMTLRVTVTGTLTQRRNMSPKRASDDKKRGVSKFAL